MFYCTGFLQDSADTSSSLETSTGRDIGNLASEAGL